ncbi:MAG: GTP 3',8-cyclase MoaA [Pseudomonadota bacterium]
MQSNLIDHHGRIIDYLRVSITDLCNFRCIYCRPPQGVKLIPHADILRYEEILKIISVSKNLGIRKVRITGGEPLVRRGVVDFISRLTHDIGLEDVALTTNGSKLDEMAWRLREAGLTRVNISLDTLRRDCFYSITGVDGLAMVMKGIQTSFEAGFSPIKINVVLLKGFNEIDVPEFARLTLNRPLDVRFIERMPFGNDAEPINSPNSFGATEVLGMIENSFGTLIAVERSPLDGPARMLKIRGAQGRIGIIDPVTGHFCPTCNRLRLTARGTIRPCLLSPLEIDLRSFLRTDPDDSQIEAFMKAAVMAKPASRYSNIQRMEAGMNTIGG